MRIARQASEQRAKNLLAYLGAAPDALIVVDSEGLIQFANLQLERLFGFERVELLGQPIEILMPERARERHQQHMQHFMAAPSVRPMGTRLDLSGMTKDGREFPIEVSLSPVATDDGPQIVAAIRDVTERRQLERSLSGILENSLNEIYIFDANSLRFIQVNRGARRNLGYSMEEMRGLTAVDLNPEFTLDEFQKMVQPLRDGHEEILVFETLHRRKDNSRYGVEVHLQYKMFDGSPVFVAIILDLTERQETQAVEKARSLALEEIAAGRSLDQVLATICTATEQQAPQLRTSIRLLSADGTLRLRCAPSLPVPFAQATESLQVGQRSCSCGAAAESLSRVIIENIQTDVRAEDLREVAREAGIDACWSEPIIASDGRLVGTLAGHLGEARQPTKHELKLVRNASSLMIVATERDQARLRLKEANELLEQRVKERTEDLNDALAELQIAKVEADNANATKTRFLAAATHDLRQPLQSLELYRSALAHQAEPTRIKETTQKMRGSLATMGELLGALLDIAKLDSGSITAEKRDFSLAEVLERSCEQARLQAELRGLSFESEFHDDLVHSDPALLQRIIDNYLGNAIRYTDAGTISVRSTRDAGQVRIEISDSGPGIPAEEIDTIFEEYYQLDNANRDRGKGLGLGLAIVKHIGRLLDHQLEVSSVLGEGSTFSVDVPLSAGATETTSSSTTLVDTEPAFEAQTSSVRKVLLIDDDSAILDSTTMLLEVLGFEVHAASNGDEAVKHIEKGLRPDMVISDYRLPGKTGIEIIKDLRKLSDIHLPAIIITGDAVGLGTHGVASDDFAVLQKPVDTDELIALLDATP